MSGLPRRAPQVVLAHLSRPSRCLCFSIIVILLLFDHFLFLSFHLVLYFPLVAPPLPFKSHHTAALFVCSITPFADTHPHTCGWKQLRKVL
jgi:hypothetical protein